MDTYKPVDLSLTYVDMSEERLKSLWKAWYPGGSGPLGCVAISINWHNHIQRISSMRQICALIESIAHLRGFDVAKWK